jgi:hypothetical protein
VSVPDPGRLCENLIRAETEEEVVNLLKSAGYWDNPDCWRYYGDNELNWSQAGGQQARADFAFNEKVVNSIDSVLTRLCMEADINPESDQAPRSIREAAARFVESSAGDTLKTTSGRVEDWPRAFRTKVAEQISVFATERDKSFRPCICIADAGEGHTPEAFPKTFVSLGQRNKVGVPFVQGKFCQGGSGVSRYGGENKLQLIVSRRRPSLVGRASVPSGYPTDATDDQWGFTVVRRETGAKMPFLSYLAPLDAAQQPRKGRVLRFSRPTLAIFPQGDDAFQREVESGTLIKLYEYQLKATSNIIRRSGLLAKLDLLLPEPALPFRIHECRSRFHENASKQETTISGLFARLQRSESLESVEPDVIRMHLRGKDIDAKIFAFRPDSSKTYRSDEGIVFTVNGQTHGYIKANFFSRSKVGLQRLAQDLLVVVDCSALDPTELSDLFMSSRDRLADNALAAEIETRLQEELSSHEGLRALKSRRIHEELQEQLGDNKPLEDVLRSVLKRSPALARLFGRGERLSNPFRPEHVRPAEVAPLLRPHPTYFRFANKESGVVLKKVAHLGQKCRLTFVTDAENHYFTRKYDAGKFAFEVLADGGSGLMPDYVGPNLTGGRCSLSFELPENAKVGDRIAYRTTVRDAVTQVEFLNEFEVSVAAAQEARNSPSGSPKPRGEPGGATSDGEGGIAFPEVHWLPQSSASWSRHFRSKEDCLNIVDDGEGEVEGSAHQPNYKFYMNEDNPALQSELKLARANAIVVRKQYEVSAVLFGLALIHDDQTHKRPESETEEENPLYLRVRDITRAVAPFLIPMIQGLGELSADDLDQSDLAGQAA